MDLPAPNFPLYKFDCFDEITDEDIERAALECRELWGLGEAPIQDLLLVAEGAGCVVVRKKTHCPAIDGFSSWSDWVGHPLIFLSSDKENAYRSRFDLAHELGHLCLHTHLSDENGIDNYQLGEEQAHKFAGALLLPARTLSQDIPEEPSWGDFLLLKRKWGVCVAAIIKRLRQLELISEKRERYLFKRRNIVWGNTSEPGDDIRAPEVPRLLRRSLDLLLQNDLLLRERVSDYFCLSNNDLKQLMFLPDDYFEVGKNAGGYVSKLNLRELH